MPLHMHMHLFTCIKKGTCHACLYMWGMIKSACWKVTYSVSESVCAGLSHSDGQLQWCGAAVWPPGGEQEEERVHSPAAWSSQPEPVHQDVAGPQPQQQKLPSESLHHLTSSFPIRAWLLLPKLIKWFHYIKVVFWCNPWTLWEALVLTLLHIAHGKHLTTDCMWRRLCLIRRPCFSALVHKLA